MIRILPAFLAIYVLFNPIAVRAQDAPPPAAQAVLTPAPTPTPASVPTPAPTVEAKPQTVAASSSQQAEIDFDRFEDTTLYFKTSNGSNPPKPLKTELYDLKYLGTLKPPADDPSVPPYFLFSGKGCKDCLQDMGIYAIRPFGGKPVGYVYPGRILESRSRATVLESRAFFGRCLPRQRDPVYVVFQRERVDRRGGMQSSVLIAEPGSDHMDERLLERHLPRVQDTLRLVKAKSCHEIDGRNRLTLKRPLDLNARHTIDADADDDDDDTKENQTDDDLSPSDAAGH